MNQKQAIQKLITAGYPPYAVRVLPDGRVAWLHQLMHTCAILVASEEELVYGYSDRWCYATRAKAEAALEQWATQGGTEPSGWHRHPDTGRRRPEGNAALEKVHG